MEAYLVSVMDRPDGNRGAEYRPLRVARPHAGGKRLGCL